MQLADLGRLLVIGGLVIAVLGIVLIFANRIPLLGRLPGDIRIETDGIRVYAPLATMLLISLVLSLVLTLLANLFRQR